MGSPFSLKRPLSMIEKPPVEPEEPPAFRDVWEYSDFLQKKMRYASYQKNMAQTGDNVAREDVKQAYFELINSRNRLRELDDRLNALREHRSSLTEEQPRAPPQLQPSQQQHGPQMTRGPSKS